MTTLPSWTDPIAAERLLKERFGWLSPEGGLLACSPHAHLDVLASRGAIGSDEILAIKRQEAEMRALRAACLDLEKRGEHPEWHRFETSEAEFSLRLLANLDRPRRRSVSLSEYNRAHQSR
jgi:hypothetical protein